MDWGGKTHNLDVNVNFTIHPICLLNHLHLSTCYLPPPLPQHCLKRREIYGAQGKTGIGGISSMERGATSGAVCGNTGHRSPRKLPPSEPLLREQLVCLCNSRRCISPQPGRCRPRVVFHPHRDLTIPRKQSQAPRKQNQTPQQLKSSQIRALMV